MCLLFGCVLYTWQIDLWMPFRVTQLILDYRELLVVHNLVHLVLFFVDFFQWVVGIVVGSYFRANKKYLSSEFLASDTENVLAAACKILSCIKTLVWLQELQ